MILAMALIAVVWIGLVRYARNQSRDKALSLLFFLIFTGILPTTLYMLITWR